MLIGEIEGTVHAEPTSEPYEAIHCPGELPGGAPCGVTLWRLYADRLEISMAVRGRGERLDVEIPLHVVGNVTVRCPRCRGRWWLVSPREPRALPEVAGILKAVA